jgi:hypothetical protein
VFKTLEAESHSPLERSISGDVISVRKFETVDAVLSSAR